jgi:hypothetical protein
VVSSRQVDLAHVMSDRSGSSRSARLSKALAAELDAIGVMNHAIEDRICHGGIAHELVLSVDGSWLVMISEPAL